MQAEAPDWTVPASLRALLWWPPTAFLVVLVDPTAAAGTIAVVGAVLAVLGVLGATVGGVLARRMAQQRPDPVPLAAVEPVVEQRAA